MKPKFISVLGHCAIGINVFAVFTSVIAAYTAFENERLDFWFQLAIVYLNLCVTLNLIFEPIPKMINRLDAPRLFFKTFIKVFFNPTVAVKAYVAYKRRNKVVQEFFNSPRFLSVCMLYPALKQLHYPNKRLNLSLWQVNFSARTASLIMLECESKIFAQMTPEQAEYIRKVRKCSWTAKLSA